MMADPAIVRHGWRPLPSARLVRYDVPWAHGGVRALEREGDKLARYGRRRGAALLAAGCVFVGIAFWLRRPVPFKHWVVTNGMVDSLAFRADGRAIAAGFSDGGIRIWKIGNGKLVRRLKAAHPVNFVSFTRDDRLFVASGDQVPLTAWETAGWRKLCVLPDSSMEPALSSTGQIAITADSDGDLHVWSIGGSSLLHTERRLNIFDAMALSPDGRALAADSELGIRLWDARTWRPLRVLAEEQQSTSLAISPDGQFLASASADGGVEVWRVSDGRHIQDLRLAGGVYTLAFSPDGRFLATGASSSEDAAVLWDCKSWTRAYTFPNIGDFADSVAFSPDGRLVAFGCGHGDVLLWKLADVVKEPRGAGGSNHR